MPVPPRSNMPLQPCRPTIAGMPPTAGRPEQIAVEHRRRLTRPVVLKRRELTTSCVLRCYDPAPRRQQYGKPSIASRLNSPHDSLLRRHVFSSCEPPVRSAKISDVVNSTGGCVTEHDTTWAVPSCRPLGIGNRAKSPRDSSDTCCRVAKHSFANGPPFVASRPHGRRRTGVLLVSRLLNQATSSQDRPSTPPARPRGSISRSGCGCITSIGATRARRRCCWSMAAAIIAATGTGWRPRCASDWHVLAPDLRGHGDSQWSPDGNYSIAAYIYDLAQLIHQQELAPVTIVAHSLGGMITLRYTGIYPGEGAQARRDRRAGGDPAGDGRAREAADRRPHAALDRRAARACPGACRAATPRSTRR